MHTGGLPTSPFVDADLHAFLGSADCQRTHFHQIFADADSHTNNVEAYLKCTTPCLKNVQFYS